VSQQPVDCFSPSLLLLFCCLIWLLPQHNYAYTESRLIVPSFNNVPCLFCQFAATCGQCCMWTMLMPLHHTSWLIVVSSSSKFMLSTLCCCFFAIAVTYFIGFCHPCYDPSIAFSSLLDLTNFHHIVHNNFVSLSPLSSMVPSLLSPSLSSSMLLLLTIVSHCCHHCHCHCHSCHFVDSGGVVIIVGWPLAAVLVIVILVAVIFLVTIISQLIAALFRACSTSPCHHFALLMAVLLAAAGDTDADADILVPKQKLVNCLFYSCYLFFDAFVVCSFVGVVQQKRHFVCSASSVVIVVVIAVVVVWFFEGSICVFLFSLCRRFFYGENCR